MKEKLEKKTLGRNQIKLRKFWNSIGNNLLKGKDKNDYDSSKKMTIKIKSQRKIYSILFIKRKSITWWRYLIQKKKKYKSELCNYVWIVSDNINYTVKQDLNK